MGALSDLLGRLFGSGGGGQSKPPTASLDTRNVDRRQPIDVERQAKGEQATAETREALSGGFMPVVSSWVQGIRWIRRPSEGEDMGVLYVMFRSGAICEYSGISEAFYDEFFAAGSKGRFVHLYLYNRDYRLVAAGQKGGGRRRRR